MTCERAKLVGEATEAVIQNLYELADKQQGGVKTWQIEQAIRAGMEVLLIMYVREVVKPSKN